MQILHWSILFVALAFAAQAAPISKSIETVEVLAKRAPPSTTLSLGGGYDAVSKDTLKRWVVNHINKEWDATNIQARINAYRGFLNEKVPYFPSGNVKMIMNAQLEALSSIEVGSWMPTTERLRKLGQLEHTMRAVIERM